jgi:hypothetical protein
MKKIFILGIWICCCISYTFSQTYTATLAIGDVFVSGLKAGDEIIVPIRLIEKSGGYISGFSLFLEFDHKILSWRGTYLEPLNGVRNFHKNTQYSNTGNWVFNDNSNQVAAIWYDPTFVGQEVLPKDILFEIVFTYNGGKFNDSNKVLSWGTTFDEIEGQVVRGVTELYSEIPDFYELTLINGTINLK